MGRLTSELFVRLMDGVTKPAQGIARAFNGIGQSVTRLNGAGGFGQNLANSAARMNTSLDAMRGRMFDAVAAGYALQRALTAPITAAAEFETVLEDMGQKAGIPVEQLGALGEEIKEIARNTNQASMEIAAAVDNMLGMGASQEVALAAAAPIGQAATAYNAATQDLANASYAAVQNLGVAASDIGTAIDIMAFAGKEGAFELKDMAQYFPSLGAAYQRLGQDGTQSVADLSAALQIVRRGTGDASTAATNLNNVLQKIYAPATVAAFKKQGVDVFKEMADAAERGLDPIEAIAELTNETLDGDLSRLGNLFQDAQVQAGITSLIMGLEDYRRIRDEAMSAEGTVSEDYLRRIRTAQGAMDRWNASMQNLNITIGTALLPALNDMLDRILPIIGAVGDWVQANPELTSSIITAAAAIVAFRVALTALKWAGLFSAASAIGGLAKAFTLLGRASGAAKSAVALQTALAGGANYTGLQKFGTALGAIVRAVPGVGLLSSALGAIGGAVATISLPVWGTFAAVAAAVGAAGVLVWKYWDRITSVLSGVGSVISDLIPDFELSIPHIEKFQKLGQGIADGWNAGLTKLQEFGTWISNFFQQEVLSEEEKAAFAEAGREWAQGMVDSAIATVQGLVDWFAGLPAAIIAAIGSIDIGSLIQWPTPPDWLVWLLNGGNMPEKPATVTAPSGREFPTGVEKFASGGPIKKGQTGIVGDGGEPEFFTAGADGYITPFSEAGSGGGSNGRPGAPAALAFNPSLTIQGNVYGVDDLRAHFRRFAQEMHSEFEAKMAGGFADTETT